MFDWFLHVAHYPSAICQSSGPDVGAVIRGVAGLERPV